MSSPARPPLWSPAHPAHAELQLLRSGYVALAAVGENETLAKELNTGLGGERAANMVAFAVEALKLVEELISNAPPQSGKI